MLIERLGRNSEKLSQVTIENDLLAPHRVDDGGWSKVLLGACFLGRHYAPFHLEITVCDFKFRLLFEVANCDLKQKGVQARADNRAYALPMAIPSANTISPPTTTSKAARRKGVSM